MEKYSQIGYRLTVDLSEKTIIKSEDILEQENSETTTTVVKDKSKRDEQIEAMIEIILNHKDERQKFKVKESTKPVEFVLNSDMVSSASSFVKVGKVLGKGNSSGEVILMKDKVTDKEVAYKTIMLTEFNADEIRTWIHLGDGGLAPELYHFRLVNNKVEYSMEPLEGKTLQEVIDSGDLFKQKDPKMAENFAFCVLDNLLDIFEKSRTGITIFAHGDMHGGNIVLTNNMKIKLIDFGRARHLFSHLQDPERVEKDVQMLKMDMVGIIRIFCLLYSGVDFNNMADAVKQLESKNFSQLTEYLSYIPEVSRKQMFKIMSMLFDTCCAPRREGFGNVSQVASIVKQYLPPDILEFKKMIAAILFPEKFQNEADFSICQRTHPTCTDSTDGINREDTQDWDDPNFSDIIKKVTLKDIEELEAGASLF